VVVGIHGLVATWLIIAKDMIVVVAQTLASAKLYVDVTNDVLITVS
jgi:hypothetical protein